jgi:hypothetical protein
MSIGTIAPQLPTCVDVTKHNLSSLKLFGTMSRVDMLEAHLGLPWSTSPRGCCPAPPPMLRPLPATTQGTSGCLYDEIRLLVPETQKPVALGEAGHSAG